MGKSDYTIALDFYQRFIPTLSDRYLASNVFITLPNTTHPVRFGRPFRRFTTPQQKRILAFGTLFNFTYAAKGIHVQRMRDFVQEPWFLEELKRAPVDYVLLVGHIPVGKQWEWPTLHQAIRSVLPDVPMFVVF